MALKNAINNWQNNQTPSEVDLFNAMIDYFKTQPFAVVVGADRTHHHDVTYKPQPPYDALWGQSIEKEISDVFFMVFSPSKHIARMTHLQAKLEDKKKPDNTFSFTLDAGQYHMLHNRLEINDAKGVYPPDILSFPLYSDSVSSYGVFYLDANKRYDMAFEIASLISYAGKKQYRSKDAALVHAFATTADLWGYTNLKHKLNKINLSYFCPICHHCCPELLSTVQIEMFEQELLNVHVGTRVEFDVATMRQLADIFASNQKVFTEYDAFVGEMERYAQDIELLEEINGYHQIEGEQVPPRGDRQRKFNFDEVGGTYILINADMTDINEY